jgi:phosphoribosyl-ATP pyrophosphohydrolase
MNTAATPETVTTYANSPGALGFVSLKNAQGDIEYLRYDAFVACLFKQESFRHMIDHARSGICEEAGEHSTWLKKHVVYGIPLDTVVESDKTLRQCIIEEQGDLRFFLQATMNLLHISEQEVLQGNANKLAIRYKGLVYTDQAAQGRADKKEGE